MDHKYLESQFDDSHWSSSVVIKATGKMSPMLDPRRLTARQIPLLTEKFQRFDGVVTCSNTTAADTWMAMIQKDEPLTLDAGSTFGVDFEGKVRSLPGPADLC